MSERAKSERAKLAAKAPGFLQEKSASHVNKTGSDHTSLRANYILNIQKVLGNRTVGKLIQAKLKINEPGDKYEQEADRVADQVMRMPEPVVQTKCEECASGKSLCSGCAGERESVQRKPLAPEITPLIQRQETEDIEEEEEEVLQTKEVSGNVPKLTASAESSINSLRGGGMPLSDSVRAYFEPRFGYDFSHVRVNSDSQAAETAKRINARAFATGGDIVFGQGEYSPHSPEGRRLLAHELTHVVQQSNRIPNGSFLQRKCDEPRVKARTKPVFFPMHKHIVDVFNGRRVLKKNTKTSATGLIQQALVDLGFDLGTSGRNNDGVDNDYGDTTVEKVGDFQEHRAGIPRSGELDSLTLRCLDDARLAVKGPSKTAGTATQADFEIRGEKISGDGEIYFSFDDSTLDNTDDEKEIKRIAKDFKCQQITLRGIMSEDELADSPPTLADDRIKAVDERLKHHGHGDGCSTSPPTPVRDHKPVPEAGRGKIDFSEHRKVEIPEAQSQPTGGRVAAACNATENTEIAPAHSDSVDMLEKAVDELNKKTPDAESAVNLFFGSDKNLRTVRSKLRRWHRYVDRKFLNKHLCSDETDSGCVGTNAYFDNDKKKIILCPGFFDGTQPQRAETIIHESGHASVDTDDIGYDHQRLQRFLPKAPELALKNTDSYLMLVLCLNDSSRCKLLDVKDKISFPKGDPRAEEALEAVAWLEKWADEAWQSVNWLADEVARARDTGDTKEWRNPLPGLMDRVSKELGFSRPKKALPTTREVIFISGVHERFSEIDGLVRKEDFELVDKPSLSGSAILWKPKSGKEDVIEFGPDFFTRTRREQVKILYAELAKVAGISTSLIPAYVRLAEHFVTKIGEIDEP